MRQIHVLGFISAALFPLNAPILINKQHEAQHLI